MATDSGFVLLIGVGEVFKEEENRSDKRAHKNYLPIS